VADYYYFLSSLPLLERGQAAPVGEDEFLQQCAGQLDEEEFARLREVTLAPLGTPTCEVARRWQAFETYLRNELVRARADARSLRPEGWLHEEPDVFPGIQHRIDDALAAPDPLAREKALDDLRWTAVEDFLSGRQFDFNCLAGYYLKLQIAAKWRAYDPGAGAERYRNLVEACVNDAGSHREVHEE
jgi:hypothetical protein